MAAKMWDFLSITPKAVRFGQKFANFSPNLTACITVNKPSTASTQTLSGVFQCSQPFQNRLIRQLD